jgi:hypothetical protein
MPRKKKSTLIYHYKCAACGRVERKPQGSYWCPCYPTAPFRMRPDIPIDVEGVKRALDRLINGG